CGGSTSSPSPASRAREEMGSSSIDALPRTRRRARRTLEDGARFLSSSSLDDGGAVRSKSKLRHAFGCRWCAAAAGSLHRGDRRLPVCHGGGRHGGGRHGGGRHGGGRHGGGRHGGGRHG